MQREVRCREGGVLQTLNLLLGQGAGEAGFVDVPVPRDEVGDGGGREVDVRGPSSPDPGVTILFLPSPPVLNFKSNYP